MSDVFVSYARPDEGQAERVADALRASGYHVWRDDELPAHRAYAEVIEERLKGAKAVILLWSTKAARSQWVRSEANVARSAGSDRRSRLGRSLRPPRCSNRSWPMPARTSFGSPRTIPTSTIYDATRVLTL
jgi:adenylate cyclase